MTKKEIIKEIDKLSEKDKKEILKYIKKTLDTRINYKEAISNAFNVNGKSKRFLLLSICSRGDYECAGECSAFDLNWSYTEIKYDEEILDAFIDYGVDSGLFGPEISNKDILDMFLVDDDLTESSIKQILNSQGIEKYQYKRKDALDYANGEKHFLVWDNETKKVEEYIL